MKSILRILLLITGFAFDGSEKLKNGKLELETEFDFDNDVYFNVRNMAHLNAALVNHPLREPNKQIRRKMLDRIKGEEVEAITGWSCNFEKGLCDGWSTLSEMDYYTLMDIGLSARPANFY